MSANRFILVDGKLPGNYDAILALAKKISYSEQAIRALINTDYREEHTGDNASFLAAGAQIIAHENVKRSLPAKAAAPTITYQHDYTIRLGGVEAQLFHFGNAHTSGDTVVYFPNLKAVAVGDLFSSMPNPDFAAGGSLVGWAPVLAEILKLDFDIVIPGNGPVVTKASLEAFKPKLDTVGSRATGLMKDGVPKSQFTTRLNTADLGLQLSLTGDRLNDFYAELSPPR